MIKKNNKLTFFLVILVFAGIYVCTSASVHASKWGPKCNQAAADHKICPSGNNPPVWYADCVDSVNINGQVKGYGLVPSIGSIQVSVNVSAYQGLVCSNVICLKREDTSKTITIDPSHIGNSNPYSYGIDTLGCSGGKCHDGLKGTLNIVNKPSGYTCTTNTVFGDMADKNNQTVSLDLLFITCTTNIAATPTPTGVNTPTPTPTGISTPTPTPTGAPTETPTSTPTGTLTPTSTGTLTPTETPTPTPTGAPTETPTSTPTGTLIPTPTATPTSATEIASTNTPVPQGKGGSIAQTGPGNIVNVGILGTILSVIGALLLFGL